MRFATIVEDDRLSVAVVRDRSCLVLALPEPGFASLRDIAARGAVGLQHVDGWVRSQPEAAYRSIDDVVLGPVIPDPGAIYTVGHNYLASGERRAADDGRPLIYGKAPTSVSGEGAVVTWDRAVTANVDAECELGVVIGEMAVAVDPEDAMGHVFGYTCINDISSRDPWLDGDQWLLGKSLPGFCPVGPTLVTADEVDPADLRLGCTVNGVPIQDDRTARMRYSIAEIVSFLSRHLTLQPGDLIATGTPERLNGPRGPERRLDPGDVVKVWIEGVGELTTRIA